MNFGHQLYPTPNVVIAKMIVPYINSKLRKGHDITNFKEGIDYVLEPSAGTGAILDYITGKTVIRKRKEMETTSKS